MRLGSLSPFFAGVVISLYSLLIVYCYGVSFDWLREYQTLVTGLTATFAALVTVNAISQQILQTEEMEAADRQRRNFAARAALSHPLSTLMGIERDVIDKLTIALTSSKAGHAKVSFKDVIEFNENDLKLLIDCIVDADFTPADDLSKLISQLQVQAARLDRKDVPVGEEYRRGLSKSNLETYLMDALSIHARAGKLLLYARREDGSYQNFTFKDAVENSFSITGSKRALSDYLTVSKEKFGDRLDRYIARSEA